MTPRMLTALSTTVCALLLWTLVFEAYRKYRLDLFRQRMFAIRDELFDLAANGDLDFNAPAYGLLRTTLNGFIRFGSRITFASVSTIILCLPDGSTVESKKDFGEQLNRVLAPLDEGARAKLLSILDRANMEAGEQFVLGSPVFLVMLVPVAVVVLVRHLGVKVAARLRRSFAQSLIFRMDGAALAAGSC